MAAAAGYLCYKPECSHLLFQSFKKLLAHMRRTHSHDPNFLVTCGRPGCRKTYKIFASFESHIYRNHPELLEETIEIDGDILDEEASLSYSGSDAGDPDSPRSMDESELEDEKNREKIRENALRNVALFMLKTREYNRLSQTAMKSVMDETSHLLDTTVKHFQSQVERCVTQAGIEVDGIEGLREILEEKSVTVEAMATLSSSWRELKYLRDCLHFVISPLYFKLLYDSLLSPGKTPKTSYQMTLSVCPL